MSDEREFYYLQEQDAYRDYLAANDNQTPADVRALIAWQQAATAQDNLFGDDNAADRAASLATAQDKS